MTSAANHMISSVANLVDYTIKKLFLGSFINTVGSGCTSDGYLWLRCQYGINGL